jgi:ferredoxin-NADP reductase
MLTTVVGYSPHDSITHTEGTVAVAAQREEPELKLVVDQKISVANEVVSLTLRPMEDVPLPRWTPGSHIDLVLPTGDVRQYSLCGDPDDGTTWRVGVLRDPSSRGGSVFVHDTLQEGDHIVTRGPRNHFELSPAKRYVFLAGGIGVTPLIPMAASVAATDAEWELIYCARSRASMGYIGELQERFGSRVTVNADDECGLFDIATRFREVEPETHVYACGPAPLLDALTAATQHWPPGSIHMERFEPLAIDTTNDSAFTVALARRGLELDVPADRSVLEVLKDAGVPILSSCTEGTCGTCEVAVLEGEVDHRDAVLSEEERASNEMMMVCVSRCRGRRLVLEL